MVDGGWSMVDGNKNSNNQSPITNRLLCIGKIAAPHGVKGLVKILPYGDDVSLLVQVESHKITLKNPMGKYILAQIEGVDSREDAERVSGTELFISRDKLPEIEDDDTYYIEDLIGLKAVDESGEEIGKVIAVHNFGAGDLLEIKPLSGAAFLMPFSNETVITIKDVIQIKNHENFI